VLLIIYSYGINKAWRSTSVVRYFLIANLLLNGLLPLWGLIDFFAGDGNSAGLFIVYIILITGDFILLRDVIRSLQRFPE